MFFPAAKIIWALAVPSNALLLLLVLGSLLRARGKRFGARLAAFSLLLFVIVAVLPVGSWLLAPLEDRFARPDPPPQSVAGIIVLGGAIDAELSAVRGLPVVNAAAERLIELAALARRYPEARLVFAGGSGSLQNQTDREDVPTRAVLESLGVPIERVLFENDSRNTAENAAFSLRLAGPAPGEVWLLVTSAVHMPRAIGTFHAAGWPVVAWPTDYRSRPNAGWRIGLDFADHLQQLDLAAHEWLGLLAYWLSGRTEHLFPGPAG